MEGRPLGEGLPQLGEDPGLEERPGVRPLRQRVEVVDQPIADSGVHEVDLGPAGELGAAAADERRQDDRHVAGLQDLQVAGDGVPADAEDRRPLGEVDQAPDLGGEEAQELAEGVGTADAEEVARIPQDDGFDQVGQEEVGPLAQPDGGVAAEGEMLVWRSRFTTPVYP
jgi:hypothetical protein